MALGTTVIILVLVGLAIIVFLSWLIGTYNGFIRLRNNIRKSWSNIDVLLKQRSDELPKLVNTVKGYMKHERGVLENITKARSAMLNATSIGEKAAADDMISETLKSLFMVSENYPKLRANENFLQLQSRITEIENQIADRREFYNDSANTLNIRVESFPSNLIASMFHFSKETLFEATAEDKKDVKIEF